MVSRVASLESMNEGLREELEQSKAALASERADKQAQNQLIEHTKRQEQKHKFNAGVFECKLLTYTFAEAERGLV